MGPADSVDAGLLRTLAYVSAGQVSPMCSVLGGMAAQEVLKALTGKFTPLQQWLYFDALECLPDFPSDDTPLIAEASVAPLNTRFAYIPSHSDIIHKPSSKPRRKS